MKEVVSRAVKCVLEGGVLLYPTDTIWGLGCDPENKTAIDKLNAIKQREVGKNYLILIDSEVMLNKYVSVIPEVAYDLIDNVNEPLTIIYPEANKIISHLTAADSSIAIRITKNDFCKRLIQKMKRGLISTSANFSGEIYNNEIPERLKITVDMEVALPLNNAVTKPSKIIQLKANGEFKIIRS